MQNSQDFSIQITCFPKLVVFKELMHDLGKSSKLVFLIYKIDFSPLLPSFPSEVVALNALNS